jgi:hypothetical protein
MYDKNKIIQKANEVGIEIGADIEIEAYRINHHDPKHITLISSLHTDNAIGVDDWRSNQWGVLDYGVCDADEYDRTLHANCGERQEYGKTVMVLLVAQVCEQCQSLIGGYPQDNHEHAVLCCTCSDALNGLPEVDMYVD